MQWCIRDFTPGSPYDVVSCAIVGCNNFMQQLHLKPRPYTKDLFIIGALCHLQDTVDTTEQ